VWFDEERLLAGCNLDCEMSKGIMNSDVVCLCITRQYCLKVNSGSTQDNVFKEWNLCQTLNKKVVPIVMEPGMLDVKQWPPGIMSMYLGNTFYVDASGDNIPEIASRLSRMFILLGLKPINRTVTYLFRRRGVRVRMRNVIRI
jgi:hypothetical protein